MLLSGYDIGLDKKLGELIKRSSRRTTHVHMASSDKEVSHAVGGDDHGTGGQGRGRR